MKANIPQSFCNFATYWVFFSRKGHIKKISSKHIVIQSEAKDLVNSHYVIEIFPPYGRLNDRMKMSRKKSKT